MKSYHFALDDSGQLSIDFFIGLSIFLITLIIAATMISGLLVGLQTKTIDFDAVAYRTGVIIVEDPGEPSTGAIYKTLGKENQWEFIGYDQKDKVRRLGLALYKSTPRTLSEKKVEMFFDRTQFPALPEYRDRLISGDYPYRFNISLKIIGEDETYQVGDEFYPDSSYGYIRRVVLVKSQTLAEIDMYTYNHTEPGPDQFYVNITYRSLLNTTRGPQYWIEPPKEPIVINLVNVSAIKNQSQPSNVTLTNIKLTFEGKLLDGTNVSDINLPYEPFNVTIDNINYLFTWPSGPQGGARNVNESINITFPAGFFIPPSEYAVIREIKMRVRYEFDPVTVNLSADNSYDYLPGRPGFSAPYFTPAILEVRVW